MMSLQKLCEESNYNVFPSLFVISVVGPRCRLKWAFLLCCGMFRTVTKSLFFAKSLRSTLLSVKLHIVCPWCWACHADCSIYMYKYILEGLHQNPFMHCNYSAVIFPIEEGEERWSFTQNQCHVTLIQKKLPDSKQHLVIYSICSAARLAMQPAALWMIKPLSMQIMKQPDPNSCWNMAPIWQCFPVCSPQFVVLL